MIRRIGAKSSIGRYDDKKTPVKFVYFIVFCLSVALNFYLIFFQGDGNNEKRGAVQTTTIPDISGVETKGETIKSVFKKEDDVILERPGGEEDFKAISFTINSGTIIQSLCDTMAEEGGCEFLSAYLTRLLTWKFNIRSDLRKGDKIKLLLDSGKNAKKNSILAVRFQGSRVEEFNVFYFRGLDWKYGSYFFEDGTEIFPRLKKEEEPIKEFSEISSWVGDFRLSGGGHSGTDFKAEVGTPVYSPFSGKVTRINWNFRYNGDCVEIDHPREDIKTVYLHLNKVDVKPGSSVKRGQKIGESGNTGRSFAPHLHYEIRYRNNKKKVHDPFKFKHHHTYYKKIPPEEMDNFRAFVEKTKNIL